MRFLFQLGALERGQLRLGQHHPFLGGSGFQSLETVVHGLEVMAQPDAAHALWRDAQGVPFEYFVGDADLAVGGQFQRQFEHGGLDLRIHAVLDDRAMVRDFLQRRFAACFVQVLETVEAVAGIAHYAAGLTDITKLPGQLQHAELGADDLLFLSHGGLLAVCCLRYRSGLRPSRQRKQHEKPTTVRFSLVQYS